MRTTISRFATASKYLSPGNPTGLAGVLTHPSPRGELLAIYTATLSRLSKLPAHSSYRNATEALTKYRLNQLESIKPAGWDEWKTKADAVLQKYPDLFKVQSNKKQFVRRDVDGKTFITEQLVYELDEDELEFGGKKLPQFKEGPGGKEKLFRLAEQAQKMEQLELGESEWIPEPKLNAEEISQLEEKIGAGLIEEVIDVAKGELQLVDTMLEHQVWEELEEKPSPGQWEYFQRDRNVGITQQPPKP